MWTWDTFTGQWFTCEAGQASRAQFYFGPMVFKVNYIQCYLKLNLVNL